LKLYALTSILFCSVFHLPGAGQNLVPDGGFEDYVHLPENNNAPIYCLRNWTTPNGTSGDYYNKNATDKLCGVPINQFGNQQAHSGFGYGGICITGTYMEYIQSPLTEMLQKDEKYLVEVYVAKAELKSGIVTNFGVLFEDKPRHTYEKAGIPTTPPVFFYKEEGYHNRDWLKLSAVYTAKGFEKAFAFGYFMAGPAVKIKHYAHYYIDDISITHIKNATTETPPEAVKNDPAPLVTVMDTTKISAGKSIVLQNIYFEKEKAVLLENSFAELNSLAILLISKPLVHIKITGHTDNQGTESFNKTLSAARAKAVMDYLLAKGIDRSRLSYTGRGSEQPIATNDTNEGREKNRRVEFLILEE